MLQPSYENAVECRRFDDIIHSPEPTFIKMDIEGAEPHALLGAKRVLRRARTILRVCAYLICEHLWTIPKLMRGFCRIRESICAGYDRGELGVGILRDSCGSECCPALNAPENDAPSRQASNGSSPWNGHTRPGMPAQRGSCFRLRVALPRVVASADNRSPGKTEKSADLLRKSSAWMRTGFQRRTTQPLDISDGSEFVPGCQLTFTEAQVAYLYMTCALLISLLSITCQESSASRTVTISARAVTSNMRTLLKPGRNAGRVL